MMVTVTAQLNTVTMGISGRRKLIRLQIVSPTINLQMQSAKIRSSRNSRLLVAIALLFVVGFEGVASQQQQDPMTMNGGSILAMAGKDCVALAVDKRFGSGPALVSLAARPTLAASDHVLVGFTGLAGDVQSLRQELKAQVSSKFHRGLAFSGNQELSPRAMASLTSHVLYQRRQAPYYVEPLVAGLHIVDVTNSDTNEEETATRPYLCSLDMIGARSSSDTFVCSGAASSSLVGTAEALWRPDLSAEELVAVCGKAFLSALERDCLSGYGARVYLLTKDGIVEFELASRND